MRKIILIFLILAFFFYADYLLAQSCEKEGTSVSITLEKEKELVPDTLFLRLRIDVFSQKEVEAINIMGEIDRELRGLNLEYKGGKYSVYENCWWEKDKRRCSGYKGSIDYTFLLNAYSEQKRIFEILDKFKERYGERVKFEVYEPEWGISEKKRKALEEELRLAIIESAKDFSEMVSKALGKNCDIESIDYTTTPVYRPYYLTKAMERAPIEVPEPKREEKSVSVKAGIRLRCK
jgi:uncharacterized protein YggE